VESFDNPAPDAIELEFNGTILYFYITLIPEKS